MLAVSTWAPVAAILNKLLAARGHGGFSTPAQLAAAVLHGSGRVAVAMQLLAALVLLGTLAATLAGVWRLLRGERGGVDLALSGVYGLLGLIAALTVVM
jgi:hypothetical protein